MRESSLLPLMERRRVLLDQASAALRGHIVGLWRLTDAGHTVVEIVSPVDAPPQLLKLDLGGMLHQWGRLARPESRWVGVGRAAPSGTLLQSVSTRRIRRRPASSAAAPNGS